MFPPSMTLFMWATGHAAFERKLNQYEDDVMGLDMQLRLEATEYAALGLGSGMAAGGGNRTEGKRLDMSHCRRRGDIGQMGLDGLKGSQGNESLLTGNPAS